MRLAVRPVRLRLRRPVTAAWGTLTERELLEVTIEDRDGAVGRGEAAPLEPYDGVPSATVGAALDAYSAVLAAAPPGAGPEELVARCAQERDLPQALAAVDLALWDLEARRAGVPVHVLLHPRSAAGVAVNATIGAADRAGAAAEAAEAVARGFRTVKLKVGIGDDAGRVAAVRAAVGTEVAIRVDANGAWTTVEEAVLALRALAPAGIELAEEPMHGVQPLRTLRAVSPIPIAIDETAADVGAAGSGCADAVCLKIARCGGITGVLREAAEARGAGAVVYLASTFDGPLGIAAALHAGAALMADGRVLTSGLATLGMFEDPGVVLPVEDGVMPVPDGPGLI